MDQGIHQPPLEEIQGLSAVAAIPNHMEPIPGTPSTTASMTPTLSAPSNLPVHPETGIIQESTVETPNRSKHVAVLNTLLANNYPAYRDTAVIEDNIRRLRRYILTDGIPAQEDPTLRPRIWKILLQVDSISAKTYLDFVRRGPCPVREKIRNDTFRTLATDRGFKERVREDMLVRLLDAFVWRNQDRPDDGSLGFGYVQGMNVLAAPFLYIMPSEVEAFYCFTRFIEHSCPLYVQPTLEGVHRGLKLLDRCLALLDPELFGHLRSKNLSAEIYAFPSVLTFCACTPPLDQVLQLWDFLLAFGVHLNVLCVIAQIFLIREEVMESKSPMKLLRTFPPLNAQEIISIAVTIVRDIPVQLYEELAAHPWALVNMST